MRLERGRTFVVSKGHTKMNSLGNGSASESSYIVQHLVFKNYANYTKNEHAVDGNFTLTVLDMARTTRSKWMDCAWIEIAPR